MYYFVKILNGSGWETYCINNTKSFALDILNNKKKSGYTCTIIESETINENQITNTENILGGKG